MVDEIRKATNGNVVLGDRQFASQIGAAMGRRVVPGKNWAATQSICGGVGWGV
jgi:hypothetical protein